MSTMGIDPQGRDRFTTTGEAEGHGALAASGDVSAQVPEAPEVVVLRSQPGMVDRREAIRRVTLVLGGIALVGDPERLSGSRLPAANAARAQEAFTSQEVAFLDEVAETILPETGTPGAKAARTGAFMALMVTDSYSAEDQRIFRDGMRALNDASRAAHGVDFLAATPAQRLAVLEVLDREQYAYSRARENAERLARGLPALPEAGADTKAAAPASPVPAGARPHYFRMMKELALLGYFTSEIGCTQAQRYVESPGRYDPCVPLAPGERSWAHHA